MTPISSSGTSSCIPLLLALLSTASQGAVWDNSSGDGNWSTAANWDNNVEPDAQTPAYFLSANAGTVTLSDGEVAAGIGLGDGYTLTGGSLTLSTSTITMPAGGTATIASTLNSAFGTQFLGDGTLVLSNANSIGGLGISGSGRVRVTHPDALGTTNGGASVNSGATLELANITLNRPLQLASGASLEGTGTASSFGTTTLDPTATNVTLRAPMAGDILTMGNGTNDLSGGSSATTISVYGEGTVRVPFASSFTGSWHVGGGRLEVQQSSGLGTGSGSSLTLNQGTIVNRGSNENFTTGPGNHLILAGTASQILGDANYSFQNADAEFGAVSIGFHTLHVQPAPPPGGAYTQVTFGPVMLSGDPVFDVADSSLSRASLSLGPISGGATARSIRKTGSGNLTFSAAANSLAAGSTFAASGGGDVRLIFPILGSAPLVTVSPAQHPLGPSAISITDGTLGFSVNGSGTNSAQTFVVPNPITLAGTAGLDADSFFPGNDAYKILELPSVTLAADTILEVAGDDQTRYSIQLPSPLALQGDATIRGNGNIYQSGRMSLNGGLSGGPGTKLTIAEGTTSTLYLGINASSTHGGGTTISGSKVTANAPAALGTGPALLTGGTLTVKAGTTFPGGLTLQGGNLVAADINALANTPLTIRGGRLSALGSTSVTVPVGPLTVNGNFSMGLDGGGLYDGALFVSPLLHVAGNSTLTSVGNGFPKFDAITLAGDLTFEVSGTRVQSVSEDGQPRKLILREYQLTLAGPNAYSGGTDVMEGTLKVEHAGALGSGPLNLYSTDNNLGTAASFLPGLSFANPLVAKNGGWGDIFLKNPSGGLTWNGSVTLEEELIFENTASAASTTITGAISGPGTLHTAGEGRVVLTNPANSFGNGGAASVLIDNGSRLGVAFDAALGNPANGVTILQGGLLGIDGSFTTSRKITLSGVNNRIDVSAGNELLLLSPFGGTERLWKEGDGTLSIGPGVDNSARSSLTTFLNDGTLRIQAGKNLSSTSPVQFFGSSTAMGCLELAADAATNFGTNIDSSGWGRIHVDRAPGGSGSGGLHRIGTVNGNGGILNVTGNHGYGLRVDQIITSSATTLLNNTSVPLQLASVTTSPGFSSPLLTLGGSGDIHAPAIAGNLTSGLAKTGSGTVLLGPAVTNFATAITVRDGTLDMSGLNHSVAVLSFGGAASALGPRLMMGETGTLTLTDDISWYYAPGGAPAQFTGKLQLSGVAHDIAVGSHLSSPFGLTLDGPISGSAGCSLVKTGDGALRLTGAGNTQPGPVTVAAGGIQLAKTSGDGIGSGGVILHPSSTQQASSLSLTLGASHQINNSAAVTLDTSYLAALDLANFTDTIGNLTLTQTGNLLSSAGSMVRTGATGTLVMNGNITFNNNATFSSARRVLITGTGNTQGAGINNGTLDLGGAMRTIRVATTVTGSNADTCDATIETKIINGGIIKTGPRRLFLTNRENTFAGGLQITEGTVRAGGGTSLGSGPVVLANAAGVQARIDFISTVPAAQPVANNLTIGGAGSSGLTYSGPNFTTQELTGTITLQKTLAVEVTNGTTSETRTAKLNLSGTINDGAGTFGLQKTGNGTLKLAAGNTYGGTTVIQRGFLEIADASSLGDGNLPLSIDGGCLLTTTPVTLARNVAFTANGGSIRGDAPEGTTFSGTLDWGSGTSSCFGPGATILSGSTTGTGNLLLGSPTLFSSTTSVQVADHGTGHCLALRGTSSLPAGNLSFDRAAVLELGNGNFSRELGTGVGQFQMPTSTGGGWAAYGADRTVNVGASGAALTWGQASPAFLNQGGTVGALYLGSASGTHPLIFENDLELNNGTVASQTCKLVLNNGPATIDAKLTGDLLVSDPLKSATLEINGTGTLEIAGENTGAIALVQKGAGTTRFTGEKFATMSLEQGKWIFLDGPGVPFNPVQSLIVGAAGILDVSAATEDVGVSATAELKVYGTIMGSILAPALLEGNGFIDGAVFQPEGILKPTTGGTLHISGYFQTGSGLKWNGQGPVAGTQYPQVWVDNGVSIGTSGPFSLPPRFDPSGSTGFALGQSYVVILNGSPSPISGTFEDLPEDALIPVAGGLALKATYQANGDGQPLANDFGFTVVADPAASNRTLAVAGPVAVGFGEEIVLTYTLGNAGPGPVTGARFEGIVPAGAVFLGSTPAGTVQDSTLAIPLANMPSGGNGTVVMRFQSGTQRGALLTSGKFLGTSPDPDGADPVANRAVAYLPGGQLALSGLEQAAAGTRLDLSLESIAGVRYRVEGSGDLVTWETVQEFVGTGQVMTLQMPVDAQEEFFRVLVVP